MLTLKNDIVERKHRHIVDFGLALLAHTSIPLKFWPYAFKHAMKLINLLPSTSLENKSPFFTLHKTEPDLHSLHVFGLACWPLTKLFNQHKFDYRAIECIYFGLSLARKGSICYHIPTTRIYISKGHLAQ